MSNDNTFSKDPEVKSKKSTRAKFYARHAFFELFRSVLETMSDRNQDGGARLRLGPPGRLLCAMSDRYDAIYCVPAAAARARVCLPRCGCVGGGWSQGHPGARTWSPLVTIGERERERSSSVRSFRSSTALSGHFI